MNDKLHECAKHIPNRRQTTRIDKFIDVNTFKLMGKCSACGEIIDVEKVMDELALRRSRKDL